MSRKSGLPGSIKFRHDMHFVEELGSRPGTPIGRMIPIEQIEPNPNQPRQQMGDLSELTASIREKGILEPLIVRRRGERLPDHIGRTTLSSGCSGQADRGAMCRAGRR